MINGLKSSSAVVRVERRTGGKATASGKSEENETSGMARGGERRERGREVFLIDKFHSSIANKIVRNYCDYGKLIYGHIERGIAFTIPRVKNSPTSRKRAACLDMTFTFATEFDVITSWDL